MSGQQIVKMPVGVIIRGNNQYPHSSADDLLGRTGIVDIDIEVTRNDWSSLADAAAEDRQVSQRRRLVIDTSATSGCRRIVGREEVKQAVGLVDDYDPPSLIVSHGADRRRAPDTVGAADGEIFERQGGVT